MDKQQIAKEALAKTWAWATEKDAGRSNAWSFISGRAKACRIDLDNMDAAPEDMDWVAFCGDLVTGLNADDRETRECAREWSDSGWYDESSGRAASMLWRELRSGE